MKKVRLWQLVFNYKKDLLREDCIVTNKNGRKLFYLVHDEPKTREDIKKEIKKEAEDKKRSSEIIHSVEVVWN